MSTETQKLDVLAVMDSLVGVAEGMAFRLDSNQPAHDWAEKVRATRAAVAELIEAANAAKPVPSYGADEPIVFSPSQAKRLRAALARVGGAE